MYDVIIVGAGPAGLSAALVLGRCRRRVLICDAGRPRNAASHALHGFLTRDGVPPAELRRIAREQLETYPSVEFRSTEVVDGNCREGGFDLKLQDGSWHASRMLLLATGVVDNLPLVEGIDRFYGHSVFHCPYCDGWEVRDQPLAMYKQGGGGMQGTLDLTIWSSDVALCTDGPADINAEDRRRLERCRIAVWEQPIVRLEGIERQLQRIVFADGSELARSAMFFTTGFRQQSDLAERLGCAFTEAPVVDTGRYETTNVPGLFVAGDASREVQLAIVAAAEGAKAAFAINKALSAADIGRGCTA